MTNFRTDLIKPVNNLHGDLESMQGYSIKAYSASLDLETELGNMRPHSRDYADSKAYQDAKAEFDSIRLAAQAIRDSLIKIARNYREASER